MNISASYPFYYHNEYYDVRMGLAGRSPPLSQLSALNLRWCGCEGSLDKEIWKFCSGGSDPKIWGRAVLYLSYLTQGRPNKEGWLDSIQSSSPNFKQRTYSEREAEYCKESLSKIVIQLFQNWNYWCSHFAAKCAESSPTWNTRCIPMSTFEDLLWKNTPLLKITLFKMGLWKMHLWQTYL